MGAKRKDLSRPKPRDRRLPRMVTFGDVEIPDGFSIEADDWVRIQAIYAITLTDEEKTSIIEEAIQYLKLQRAIFESKFFKELHTDLQACLRTVRQMQKTYSDILLYTDSPVEQASELQLFGYQFVPFTLQKFFKDLELACESTMTKLMEYAADEKEVSDKRMWNIWIGTLLNFAESRGLDTSISKGQALSKKQTNSKFVLFVLEIQKCLPEAYRWHNDTPAALAQALAKVRTDWM